MLPSDRTPDNWGYALEVDSRTRPSLSSLSSFLAMKWVVLFYYVLSVVTRCQPTRGPKSNRCIWSLGPPPLQRKTNASSLSQVFVRVTESSLPQFCFDKRLYSMAYIYLDVAQIMLCAWTWSMLVNAEHLRKLCILQLSWIYMCAWERGRERNRGRERERERFYVALSLYKIHTCNSSPGEVFLLLLKSLYHHQSWNCCHVPKS